MSRYYKSFALLLPALIIAQAAMAQNTPLLSQSEPAGAVATPAVTPPAITVTPGVYNYVRTFVPRVPETDPAELNTLAPPERAAIATDFKDGFNRTIQVVQHDFTKDGSLVQPVDTRYQQLEQNFLPYSHTSNAFRSDAFNEQSSFYGTTFTGEGTTAVSRSRNLSTATARSRIGYLPGKSQTGQDRGMTVTQISNDAATIPVWIVGSSGRPERTGYYAANELFGEEQTDIAGGRTRLFKDKDGRLCYKAVLTEGSTEAITQYVYDDKGRLRFIMPPEASRLAALMVGTVMDATATSQLCFQYRYDAKGRLSGEQKPGEQGITEIVYDRKERVVMRRSPLEAAMGKWEITYYDKSGRIIAISLYNSTATQATWQSDIDAISATTAFVASNLLHYMATNSGEGKYPGTISGNEVMSYSYYDHYNHSGVTLFSDLPFSGASFPTAPIGAEAVTQSLRTQGMLTASRVRVVKGAIGTELGDWIESVSYYDDKGRVIQSRSRNATKSGSTAGNEMVCTYYDFRGKPLLSEHYHENKKTGHAANEATRYLYDALTGRLTETAHKVNEDTWRLLNKYEYNSLGQVSRKVLGNNAEVQEYSYNIRGQLTGINGYYAETGNLDGKSITFGQSLKYDHGFASPRYDGKITGMVWRGSGGSASSYGYSYDLSGRLTKAHYTQQVSSSWSNATTDYSVPHVTYDLNGNIKSMMQRGMGLSGGSIVPVDMDRLYYQYETASNRLMAVKDTITTDYNIGDFIDNYTAGNDYDYDVSGNLSKDLNKGISSVTYTWFNKPQLVTFSNGNTIQYVYDAAGNKLQELVTIGGSPRRTDYVGSFVYENDVLRYINTAEGRTVYTPADGKYKEEFFVKDHLGNVRSVVDVETRPILEMLATYEVASAGLEGLFFDKVSEIAEGNPASPDPGNLQSGMLNGAIANKRIGTSVLMRVMAGDKVQLNVNSFYEGYDPGTDAPVSASTMLSSIVSTLTTGAGGLGGSESHNPQLVGQMFNSNNYAQVSNIINSNTAGNRPRAYLNYVMFNENMQVIGSHSGAFQAGGAGTWGAIGMEEPMAIPTNGYLAVYLSDESTSPVYFDQLTVVFTQGHLLEETHYYPHGLPMGNIGGAAAGFAENRVKHQSNEYIKDAGLNWMDFHARQYDPQIGRFLGVDPLAAAQGQDMFSPFAAMGNQPETMIDPNGEAFSSSYMPSFMGGLPAMSATYVDGAMLDFTGLMSYLPGGTGKENGMIWGGLSGHALDVYVSNATPAMRAMILGDLNGSGAFACNHGAGGGDGKGKGGMKDIEYEDAVVIHGSRPKKPGFFSRQWNALKGIVRYTFGRSDAFLASLEGKEYDKDGGGIKFTSKDGGNQGNRNAGHADRLPVNIDDMFTIMSTFATPASAMFSPFIDRVGSFTNTFMHLQEVGSNLYQVFPEAGEPTQVKKNDTLIWLDGIMESVDKDSLRYFRPYGRDTNGYYHSLNEFRR